MSEMDRELYVLTYFFKDSNTRRNIRGKEILFCYYICIMFINEFE